MKKYLFLAFVALCILFYFSNMSYQQQTIVPELRVLLQDQPFYELLSKIEVTYWGRTISVETRGYFYFVEFLIRKAFHFIGYGLIGTIFYLLFRKLKWKLATIFACIVTFFIAMLDEYRQTFHEGRTGDFHDVLIDTAGAITFVFTLKILLALIDWLKQKKRSQKYHEVETK